MNVPEIVKSITSGKPVHDNDDGNHFHEIVTALRAAGYVPDTSLSKCSKAHSEAHLKPGPKADKRGLRVEVIVASFMGTFTQVNTAPNY